MPKRKSSPKELKLSFEQALGRLEGVVDQLEQGELELEASIEAFELGVRLSARCAAQLEDAEQRVEILTREVLANTSTPVALQMRGVLHARFDPHTATFSQPARGDAIKC